MEDGRAIYGRRNSKIMQEAITVSILDISAVREISSLAARDTVDRLRIRISLEV